jgi:hypothetical protein
MSEPTCFQTGRAAGGARSKEGRKKGETMREKEKGEREGLCFDPLVISPNLAIDPPVVVSVDLSANSEIARLLSPDIERTVQVGTNRE